MAQKDKVSLYSLPQPEYVISPSLVTNIQFGICDHNGAEGRPSVLSMLHESEESSFRIPSVEVPSRALRSNYHQPNGLRHRGNQQENRNLHRRRPVRLQDIVALNAIMDNVGALATLVYHLHLHAFGLMVG
ncbi:hypothetical protein Godav_008893 [Gossypium davidsonii]|uniref:Uncharacterized protein n=1 Tax=Gossypium davidsonii TaxID=34287 RepID=A0A7J8SCY8_GOSDV|nr:hypothetical protein [Gossypium davidsonii]